MRNLLLLGLLWVGVPSTAAADDHCAENLDFELRRLDGSETVRLCEAFGDRVVLIVNTASRCAYTGQYEGLEALHARYSERGLVVAGFPSDDFGQEPGSEAQILNFCHATYDVRFPMFEKVRVRAGQAHPLFDQLAAEAGGYPDWNFNKYLLDRQGRVVARYRSATDPLGETLIEAIEGLL